MIEALKIDEYQSVIDILYMPVSSAEHVSPLDNPVWHTFKEASIEVNLLCFQILSHHYQRK